MMGVGQNASYTKELVDICRYAPIVEELGLPPGHKVYSILVLGYPKLTFLRAVDRKPMKVRWL